MKNETLISSDVFNVCNTKEELANYLSNFLKEDGSIYFEHGYSQPSFVMKEFGHVTLYAITSKGDVRFSVPTKGSRLVKLEDLSLEQLQRIVYVINDYYLYCKYEA